MKIFKVAVDYMSYNPEDPDFEITNEETGKTWDAEQAGRFADFVFMKAGISPSSTKNISDIALQDGRIVGATASGWVGNEFAFDIAVLPKYRNLNIGPTLIERAIQQYEWEKEAYGEDTIMRLEAVNLKLGRFLAKHYGFTIETQLPDRTILVRK